MSNSIRIRKIGSKSLSLLTGLQSDFWLYAIGFLGLWGMKKLESENENEKEQNTGNDIKNMNMENEETSVIDMTIDFFNSYTMNNIDDYEYTDVIICFLSLYVYINKLSKTESTERALNYISVQLSAVSYKSRGNVQLFWTDALLPIFTNRIGVGKTIKNKVKSFSNNSNNPLRELLDWVSETPGLVNALCDAVRELVGESTGGDDIDGEIPKIDSDDNKDEKIKITDLTEKSSSVPTSGNKKRKSDVVRMAENGTINVHEKGEEEDQEGNEGKEKEEEEEEILMGTYEIDVEGDKKNVLAFMEDESEVSYRGLIENELNSCNT